MQQALPVVSVNGVVDAQISPLDRGFSYGDGVFESCRIIDGKIPLWNLHVDRLLKSCTRLLIPIERVLIETYLNNLCAQIQIADLENAVAKITITRGLGSRGYRLPTSVLPTIVIGIFPAAHYPPPYFATGVAVRVCDLRLSCNSSLAGLKHLNRLEQVLARAEWNDEAITEGILRDTHDRVIEGVFSNIFIVKDGKLLTPDLSESGVAGVMRRCILDDIAPRLAIETRIKHLELPDIMDADEIFFCNSLYGIWPVKMIFSKTTTHFSVGKTTLSLQAAVNQLLIQ